MSGENNNPYNRVGTSRTRTSRGNICGSDRQNDNYINERDFDYYEGRPVDDWYYSDYDD